MQIMYKYKLNDKCKDNSRQIAGVDLTKNWKCFNFKHEKLIPFIKTKFNEEGVVDFEEFDIETKQVLNSSILDYNRKIKIYTREHLSSLSRKELIPVAKSLLIDPVNKSDVFLIRKIIEKQNEYLEGKKKHEDDTKRFERLSEQISG